MLFLGLEYIGIALFSTDMTQPREVAGYLLCATNIPVDSNGRIVVVKVQLVYTVFLVHVFSLSIISYTTSIWKSL